MDNYPISKTIKNIPEAMSIKFNMAVYDLQRKGQDVIVLSLGEAFFKLPPFPFDKIKNWEKGYHYSSSLGLPELRHKISAYYKQEYGVTSNPDNELLISAGSKVIIYMALRAILNPGEEVIIFEPAWVSYTEQVKSCYGKPVTIPYYEGVDDLHKYLTRKTRAIIINNPNNPSGKVYSRQELKKLFDFARKHDLYVLSDEAYSDFALEEPFVSMGRIDPKKERVIVVNSLSKNFGISGWRIGYVIAHKKIIAAIFKLNQHLITCPTTMIGFYLITYFDQLRKKTKPQIIAVVKKRMRVQKIMQKIGLEYLPGSGTFYFTVSIKGSKLHSEAFATRLLKEYHVATVPGVGYGRSLDSFLRIGVGTESIERITRALLAIRKLIEETS